MSLSRILNDEPPSAPSSRQVYSAVQFRSSGTDFPIQNHPVKDELAGPDRIENYASASSSSYQQGSSAIPIDPRLLGEYESQTPIDGRHPLPYSESSPPEVRQSNGVNGNVASYGQQNSLPHSPHEAESQGLISAHTLSAEPGTYRPSWRYNPDPARLASSDLEDCEEIWAGELTEYIMDTQKRAKQLEQCFYDNMKERTAATARKVSHYYTSKISRLPQAAPTPPPIPLVPRHNFDGPPQVTSYRLRGIDQHYDHPEEIDSSMYLEDVGESVSYPQTREARLKRPARDVLSDESSDFEVPTKEERNHAAKRRRLEPDDLEGVLNGLEASIEPNVIPTPAAIQSSISVKGKAKAPIIPSTISESQQQLQAPKPPRKKPTPKKKAIDLEPPSSHPPSIAGDLTPLSRQTSPANSINPLVYELDEEVPPMRRAKKMDEAAMLKRVKALEDAQRKVWTNIARRDVAKVYKYAALGYQARLSQAERIAKLASVQARRPFTKTPKATKDTQAKAKRLMREMLVFWKKNEREERDVRKREHKVAMDRLKMEEEKREAARQARKLEFLISQTELYSHFVGSKLKTTDDHGESEEQHLPAGIQVGPVTADSLREINFDDEDQTNLYRHAQYQAQEALALARQRALDFDVAAASHRKVTEAIPTMGPAEMAQVDIEGPEASSSHSVAMNGQALMDLDSDELNFQNPSSLGESLTVEQPKMLMAQLKEYQLKGLNWLATLYEQGINGILADEMGLGKTVQSISLLAYLAETHDIWGPFLVVAPASTLHNWQQEITRFVPKLKALPYWGNVKDRATLRKFWSKKEISYNEDASFHILITSYQLVTQDQQYFQRVKWQYMILDEAQNIKNSSSVRWKTLLGFQCRNRLLLTGTPIQNSMQELWALLHFIMPSLFDSHDEFNEWFSKDIENAASGEAKGNKGPNEYQLRRLHMILKPFMLRRIKRHVQNELSEKIEIDIFVDLSARQRSLYKALLAKVSITDLLAKAANIGDAESARSLMNLVMQFRKVCNHPELFERADVVAPFSCCLYGRSGPILREGDFLSLQYSTRSPLDISIPRLLHSAPEDLTPFEARFTYAQKHLNIWTVDHIHRSIYDTPSSSSFSFLRFLDASPQEAHNLHLSPLIRRSLVALQSSSLERYHDPYALDNYFIAAATVPTLKFSIRPLPSQPLIVELPPPEQITTSAWQTSCLSRSLLRWYIPPVVAPPVALYSTDRIFLNSQEHIRDAPLESLAFYGVPAVHRDSEASAIAYQQLLPGLSPLGLLSVSSRDQLPLPTMQVPEGKRLIYDSAKLARLDTLLQELKSGDHRVLIYFQMTRMMDLMEEYLIYRQYKYLRLDGSSKLEDRRDMVMDWQTRSDIFVFILSTRAGGLGINLTAADTVIFFDHDWNPSNDAQAMDRAHRLGQTRQVTVYRLITKGTIDERIIQLARVKKDVQDIVVGNKNITEVAKPSEIVQLLLNDEQLANLDSSATATLTMSDGRKPNDTGAQVGKDLWNDDADDFFSTGNDAEEEGGTPASGGMTKKRKGKQPQQRKNTTGRKKASALGGEDL